MIYERCFNKNNQIEEYIAINNFNDFYLNVSVEEPNDKIKNELKLIQCRYKSKIELKNRSLFGYIFTQQDKLS